METAVIVLMLSLSAYLLAHAAGEVVAAVVFVRDQFL